MAWWGRSAWLILGPAHMHEALALTCLACFQGIYATVSKQQPCKGAWASNPCHGKKTARVAQCRHKNTGTAGLPVPSGARRARLTAFMDLLCPAARCPILSERAAQQAQGPALGAWASRECQRTSKRVM